MTLEQLKQIIIQQLQQSPYPNVVNFANTIGDKCWDDLSVEFYEGQNFSVAEKQDILNRLLSLKQSIVNKTLVLFLRKEDENVLNQILSGADSNLKKFIARYSASDNIRITLLGQNPDRELLLAIVAGMIDKSKVMQYKDSNDEGLRQAFYSRPHDIIMKRLWR